MFLRARAPSAQMQVVRVEARKLLQFVYVGDADAAATKCHQAGFSQALQAPVHVDVRHAYSVRQLSLRNGEFERATNRQLDRLQTNVHLAEEMGDTLKGGSLADVYQPFSQRGLVDE